MNTSEAGAVRRQGAKARVRAGFLRICEQTGCQTRRLPELMVQFPSGAWYCPEHALCFAAQDLVAYYRVGGQADWTAICELIGEVVPAILTKLK